MFDLANSVEIGLLNEEMVLTGCDETALASGANLAVIGDEMIQFGAADPLGPGRWRLSRLLRGRRGTEWAASAHVAEEGFALIERSTLQAIELDAGVGTGSMVLMLASGLGDAEPAVASRAATGEALRPPSPVHLQSADDGGGGKQLGWVRRSRLGWVWQSGAPTPLSEERELYAVTLTGPDFVREAEVETAMFHYDAAMRAADGPGPVVITIVQLGTHGRSRPATMIIE